MIPGLVILARDGTKRPIEFDFPSVSRWRYDGIEPLMVGAPMAKSPGRLKVSQEHPHLVEFDAPERLRVIDQHIRSGHDVGWTPPYGVAVFDSDTPATAAWMSSIAPAGTPTQRRHASSVHHYYRIPEDVIPLIKNCSKKWKGEDGEAWGLDIRCWGSLSGGFGGQVVIPPSSHKDGRDYVWEIVPPPDMDDLPWMPEELEAWCREHLKARAKKPKEGAAMDAARGRHDKIRDYVMVQSWGPAKWDVIEDKARAHAEKLAAGDQEFLDRLHDGEFERILAWVRENHDRAPKNSDRTDMGLGELFTRVYTDLGHVADMKSKGWKKWDETLGVWDAVHEVTIFQRVMGFADLFWDAAAEADKDDREVYLKAYAKLRTDRSINSTFKLAKAILGKPRSEWDQNEDLVTFPAMAGYAATTLNTRTGETYAPRQGDLITSCLGMPYAPKTKSRELQQFMKQTFTGTHEGVAYDVRQFLWTMDAISLSGRHTSELTPMLYGRGATGKTTYLGIKKKAFGGTAVGAPFAAFQEPKTASTGPDPHVASWAGKRLLVCSEVPDGVKLGDRFKSLTGGDILSTHAKFQDPFEFKPQYTVWVAGNQRPKAGHLDTGVERRLKIVPADNVVPEPDRDAMLIYKLTTDEVLAGYSACVLAALKAYIEADFKVTLPSVVVADTRTFTRDQNPLAEWADECVVAGPGQVRLKGLREHFGAWAASNRVPKESIVTLSTALKFRKSFDALGVEMKKAANNEWFAVGVRVRADDDSVYPKTSNHSVPLDKSKK